MNFLIEQPSSKVSDACVNIINSVAAMELALSTILFTEGEKIQKITTDSPDINTISTTHNTVINTIKNIARLELILSDKLETAIKCCNHCDTICCIVDGGIFQ